MHFLLKIRSREVMRLNPGPVWAWPLDLDYCTISIYSVVTRHGGGYRNRNVVGSRRLLPKSCHGYQEIGPKKENPLPLMKNLAPWDSL